MKPARPDPDFPPQSRQAPRSGPSSLKVSGSAFEIKTTGLRRFDRWRDPYHLALSLNWPQFFALMLTLELLLNSLFAFLYLQQPGAIGNARPGRFDDAFFFSLETLATVGYGVMAPATLYGHIVSAVEIVTGVAFTALLTGLVFGRFSRPKAKILYADHPVVCRYSGKPTLMVRIANGRRSPLADGNVRIYALLMVVTDEGERFRRPIELRLVRDQFPLFALTWTLLHVIDETSPLHGWDEAALAAQQARLFVHVKAWDPALAASVQDIFAYAHDTIRFGMRYVDAVSWDEAGRTIADIGKLSMITEDVAGPPRTL